MSAQPAEALETMHGIGHVNAEKLRAAGIKTPHELCDTGTEAAFNLIRNQSDPGACFHLLLGLEAAIQDMPKSQLPQQRREQLRQWYRRIT